MRTFTPEQQRILDAAVAVHLVRAGQDGEYPSRYIEDADLADHLLKFADRLLTPAQRHADKLLPLLREWRASPESVGAEWSKRMAALVDEIDPPKPPTLDEALEVLRKARGRMKDAGFSVGEIDVILANAPKP